MAAIRIRRGRRTRAVPGVLVGYADGRVGPARRRAALPKLRPTVTGVAAGLAIVGAGVSARSALSDYAYGSGGDAHAVRVAIAGLPGDDAFPGAALLYAGEESAAAPRAPAATGYYDIPAELARLTPASYAVPVGVVAAPAVAFRGASGVDSMRAAQCLATAIYYEAASESDDGQRAVAQVVLNRVRHPAFPKSVCGVVYQGQERATGCQFSFTCDGALARAPSSTGYARALRIAHEALGGRVYAPVGNATHYHTFRVWPYWGRSLVMTAAVGAHFFHRWKGYWGTPSAFTNRYAGHEPVIAPWRPRGVPADPLLAAPVPAAMPAALAAVPLPTRETDMARVQPAWRDSGAPIAETADADSQVLDRWKDSGKPLR